MNPELADSVPLSVSAKEKDKDEGKEFFARAEVFQVWDKEKREVIWVAKGFTEQILANDGDPLGLENPSSFPEADLRQRHVGHDHPGSGVRPHPTSARGVGRRSRFGIKRLTKALRRRGIYSDQRFLALGEAGAAADNEFVPIEAGYFDKILEIGGLEGVRQRGHRPDRQRAGVVSTNSASNSRRRSRRSSASLT